MVTSGLVVTLDPGSREAESAVASIGAHEVFTAGDRDGFQLPLALEAKSAEASEHWCDWLRGLPGVASVEVVFVHWDEVEHEAG
jgi:hypothetical protein